MSADKQSKTTCSAETPRTLETLRQSEEQYRFFFENSADGLNVSEKDKKTGSRRLVLCNDRYVEMSGHSREELFAAGDLNELSVNHHEHALKGDLRAGFSAGLSSWKRPDGKENYYEWTAYDIDLGDRVRIVGIDRDVTEPKRAEITERETAERLNAILHSTVDAINVIGLDGTVLWTNPVSTRGNPKALGAKCWQAYEGRDARCPHCPHSAILRDGQGRDYETVAIEADGERRHYWVRAVPLRDAQGVIYAFLENATDITERKLAEEASRKLEEQMRHAQKLESLGVLAGGIAHDFNNLLVAILGNVDMALQDLSSVSPAKPFIADIEKAALRAADLCRQMLAYSGKGRFELLALNLSEVVEEMYHMLEVSVSKKAVLRCNLAKDLPAIEADPTQMRQVIMNLITNASEALGSGSGVITLSTGTIHCDRGYFAGTYLDETLPEGLYVYAEVADTGCGMDEETRARIFDPFFTTKFTGRGLGLSAVLGIVRGHKGAIKVYSEEGKGTTFKVLFPAVDSRPSAARTQEPQNAEWRGKGTVLVVDDEDTVRATASAILERRGFTVLAACDGHEALETFRECADDIACVVLDLTMPRMDGEEAFQAIRRIKPDARVLLSSGYTEQDVVARFAGKGLAGFIQKPYRASALTDKMKQILEG